MAKFIIERHITTCNQRDYYNGKDKSRWSHKKSDAFVFDSWAVAFVTIDTIVINTCETYPLNIIEL